MKLIALSALLSLSVSGLRLHAADAASDAAAAAAKAATAAAAAKQPPAQPKKASTENTGDAKGETGDYKSASKIFTDLPDITGGFQSGQHFQLKSRQDGNPVMYVTSTPVDVDVYSKR